MYHKLWGSDQTAREEWVDVLKAYATYLMNNHIAKLPEEKRPNIEAIKKHLSDPLDKQLLRYIQYDFNVLWRGIFIKENITKVLKDVDIKKVGKPCVIIVGQHHFKDIEDFLELQSCPMKSYPCNYVT